MPFRPVPRLSTFSYTGPHRYFLTICVNNRARVFIRGPAVDLVRVQLQHAAAREGFAVIAYCFMPDHLHLLVEATTEAADLIAFARLFKQRSAFHWKRAFGTRLWQRGYYEHVLRVEEGTREVARYILANPVRAALVGSPAEYPYSGSLVVGVEELFDYVV